MIPLTSAASWDSATPQSVVSRALQHALQSSDGLLEWLPIGVCVCDAEGYLVHYNNRAAELTRLWSSRFFSSAISAFRFPTTGPR